MLEIMRRWQAHFGRHVGANFQPSIATINTLRQILKDKLPAEGVSTDERNKLRLNALTMLAQRLHAPLDDENLYDSILRE